MEKAAQSKAPIALLARVGDVHAAVARSTIVHDSHDALAHAIGHNVLPVLAACFGGVERFSKAFVSLKAVHHALKQQRAQQRVEGARSAVRAYTAHLSLASILAWAGSLQSLACYERLRRLETHAISFEGGQLTIAPTRTSIGHHLRGPKKPVGGRVQQLLDLLKLNLGSQHARLAEGARSFDGEGIGRTRPLREVLGSQTDWLWLHGAFRDELPMRLTLFFKLSADCGKLGRFSLSKRPLLADLVSILPDDTVFRSQFAAAVASPQLFLIAAEQDTIDSVCGQLQRRADELLSLADPLIMLHDDGTVAHEVTFKVIVECGFDMIFVACCSCLLGQRIPDKARSRLATLARTLSCAVLCVQPSKQTTASWS